MTREDIRKLVFEELGNIAPEIDLAHIDDTADLREEMDIDSISFLNLMIAFSKRLEIDVPERDYGQLNTLASTVEYLVARTAKATTT